MIDQKTRYTLEPGSRKHVCPACQKRRFVKYIDEQTGDYLNPNVGRCDREHSCGYHLPPREYFDAGGDRPDSLSIQHHTVAMPKKNYTLNPEPMFNTLDKYDNNQLLLWLATLPGWDSERAHAAATRYNVGTGRKAYDGAAIFWQVDEKQRVRTGKIIRYNSKTGKRVKDVSALNYNFIHKLLERAGKLPENYELLQCLYGAHLLPAEPDKPVAIVESEKTAIIASEYFPDMLWLACGGAGMINHSKRINALEYHILDAVKGRDVTLYPDNGQYQQWKLIADKYGFQISELLEQHGIDDGSDLADYLQLYDVREFLSNSAGYPDMWDSIAIPEHGSVEYIDMLKAEKQAGIELNIKDLELLESCYIPTR